MTITAESFFRLNMRDLHDCLNSGGRWTRLADVERVTPSGRKEREGILLWGGGADSSGTNWIYWRWTRTGSVGEMEGSLTAVSTPCHLGGRRWWFVCPESGKRCQKLFYFGGYWVSRDVAPFRLYASQLTYRGLARSTQQAETVLARLGVRDYERFRLASRHKFPDRPRYMRWKRYARLCDDLYNRYQDWHMVALIKVTALAAHAGQKEIYRECLAEAKRREIEWEAERGAAREAVENLHSQ